jgi:phosphate transport system substrate-binding protein
MKATLTALILLALTGACMGSVSMSGSTTVLPLGVALSEAYTPGGVQVSGGGTGAGMQALITGTTDIAMSSRQITTEESAKVADGVVTTDLGYDALCFITSSDVGVSKLTPAQIKSVYDGSVTNWNQIGGNDVEINAIGREGGSGTKDTFLEQVMGDKKAECTGEKAICMSSAEVLTSVKSTPGSIGYVGLSYAHGVNLVAVNGIIPTQETIKDGKYPLVRELYLYSHASASQEVKDFLTFAVSEDGKKVASDNGFIPR